MMFSSLFAGVQAAFTNVLLAIFPVAAAVIGVLVSLAGLRWVFQMVRGVDEDGGRWGEVGIDAMSYQVLDDGVTVIRDRNGDEFAAVSEDGETVVYAADVYGVGDEFFEKYNRGEAVEGEDFSSRWEFAGVDDNVRD